RYRCLVSGFRSERHSGARENGTLLVTNGSENGAGLRLRETRCYTADNCQPCDNNRFSQHTRSPRKCRRTVERKWSLITRLRFNASCPRADGTQPKMGRSLGGVRPSLNAEVTGGDSGG